MKELLIFMFFMTILAMCFLPLVLCKISERKSELLKEENFKYQDDVEVVSGFYSGQKAKIMTVYQESLLNDRAICYSIRLNSGLVIEEPVTNLKKLEET